MSLPVSPAERFAPEATGEEPAVRGWLHRPAGPITGGLVLTHGAGSSAEAPFLVALAESLAARGIAVLRCDLPFRQRRPTGPPGPGDAPQDRAGLRAAVRALGERLAGPVALGGHSYGGRQASMLIAETPSLASALLLTSYPLHPPGRPAQSRTDHLPRVAVPTLFVHGSRDPFGTEAELRAALTLVPARRGLLLIEGAGHDLLPGRGAEARQAVATRIADAWTAFGRGPTGAA